MGINFDDVSVCIWWTHRNGVGDAWLEHMGCHVCLSMVIDNVYDSYKPNVL